MAGVVGGMTIHRRPFAVNGSGAVLSQKAGLSAGTTAIDVALVAIVCVVVTSRGCTHIACTYARRAVCVVPTHLRCLTQAAVASAVNVNLVPILDTIDASVSLAGACLADLVVTVCRREACFSHAARPAVGIATIDVGLLAVLDVVCTAWSDANAALGRGCANARGATSAAPDAELPCATQTSTSAINSGLVAVFDTVSASGSFAYPSGTDTRGAIGADYALQVV